MASIPDQFYADCTFPSHLSHDFSTVPTAAAGGVGGGGSLMWSSTQESLVPLLFDNNALFDHVVSSPQSADMTSSSVKMSSYPGKQAGTSDDFAVPSLSDYYKVDLCAGIMTTGVDNFGGVFQQPNNMCQFRDEYSCGFLDDFKPLYPASGENWGIIQGNQPVAIEESNIKVGRYSEEERKERIVRYLKKRNQRNFNKTIKYACRKTLADRRVRVRGRFARNTELCQERMIVINNDDPDQHHKEESFCTSDHATEIKTDEDDWLQEAMASLMYLPYVAG